MGESGQLSMVALGSSFAAGPGIEPVVDRWAMRSGRNYAHLVADALDASLTDATVSGATTPTILSESQRTLGRRFAPQIEAVSSATDLVTITVGGNDLGYLGGLLLTSMTNRLGEHRYSAPVAKLLRARATPTQITDTLLASTTRGMVLIVEEVRSRAPSAQVVLVDYLPVLDAGTEPSAQVPLSTEQVDRARGVAATLSEIYLAAGQQSGADVVSASVYTSGHGAGSASPWVNGFSARRLASSFHPNAAGMRVVADQVLELLPRSLHHPDA